MLFHLATCAAAGTIAYGNQTCYGIVNTSTTWNNAYAVCNNQAHQMFGGSSNGIPAIFPSWNDYMAVIPQITALQGTAVVWLGAYAVAGPDASLDEFCWMSVPGVKGSQITIQQTPLASSNGPCLYVDTASPNVFMSDNTTAKKYVLCQYSKISVEF